jgi:hypothetical protein
VLTLVLRSSWVCCWLGLFLHACHAVLCCALQVTGATFDKETGLWTVTAASGEQQ